MDTSVDSLESVPTSPQNEQRHHEELPEEHRREFPGIPGSLSVTVRHSNSSSCKFWWKLDLVQDEQTQDIVIVGFQPESSFLHFNFFREGDILKEVNLCEVRHLTVRDIQELLDNRGGGMITVSATRPTGDPQRVEATAITLHGSDPVLDREESEMITGIEFECSTSDKELCTVSEKSIEGYLGQSVLETGDEVLWMNGIDCFDTKPDDLALLLNAKFMGADYICIQARRKPKWSVRRAAVAAAGGSMMSVGAAIMATPLHPVGHALAIGGVGVLSTEFEGPRRAMQSAKDHLSRYSGSANTKDENGQEVKVDDSNDPNNESYTTRNDEEEYLKKESSDQFSDVDISDEPLDDSEGNDAVENFHGAAATTNIKSDQGHVVSV